MSFLLRDVIRFLKEDVWKISLKDLSARKSILIKNLRIVLLAFKGFNEDKCALRAKALTFYFLLSVVPLVAFAFGVAKGFGMQKVLENEFRNYFAGQVQIAEQVRVEEKERAPEQDKTVHQAESKDQSHTPGQAQSLEQVEGAGQGEEPEQVQVIGQAVDKIIGLANQTLEQTKGGLIAGIGILMLFYTVFNLLQNIEASFNDIWGTPRARTFSRKLSDYLSVLFIAPILFVLSSGMTVFVKTQIEDIVEKIALLGFLRPLIVFSLNILPFLVTWLLGTFLYMFMPNTRVRFRSGFMGGLVAGTMYVIWQNIYISSQIGVVKYGAIYGSLAIIPLFMIWLQVSWLIVLFGAEIAFAHQNVDTYEMEPLSETVSFSLKKILSLRIANICIKNFVKGENPWSGQKIAEFLELPVRLTNKLLSDLVECHVLSETEGEDEIINYYQPARDVNSLTIHYVASSLEKHGNDDISFAESEEIEKIKKCYEKLDATYNESDGNILLKDI